MQTSLRNTLRVAAALLGVLIAAGCAGPGAMGTPPLASTPSAYRDVASIGFAETWAEFLPGSQWLDGGAYGGWVDDFNGYGSVGVAAQAGAQVLQMQPAISLSPSETHAALVRTATTYGNFDATFKTQTIAQLRMGSSPNPWEVGWILWSFTDDAHFYYFIPKPDGWELGKEDPTYPGGQRFLASSSTPVFPIGAELAVRIKTGTRGMTVWVNGQQIVTFSDHASPYQRGSLALYTEDAAVAQGAITLR